MRQHYQYVPEIPIQPQTEEDRKREEEEELQQQVATLKLLLQVPSTSSPTLPLHKQKFNAQYPQQVPILLHVVI
jgi:hypothetical protein